MSVCARIEMGKKSKGKRGEGDCGGKSNRIDTDTHV